MERQLDVLPTRISNACDAHREWVPERCETFECVAPQLDGFAVQQ